MSKKRNRSNRELMLALIKECAASHDEKRRSAKKVKIRVLPIRKANTPLVGTLRCSTNDNCDVKHAEVVKLLSEMREIAKEREKLPHNKPWLRNLMIDLERYYDNKNNCKL